MQFALHPGFVRSMEVVEEIKRLLTDKLTSPKHFTVIHIEPWSYWENKGVCFRINNDDPVYFAIHENTTTSSIYVQIFKDKDAKTGHASNEKHLHERIFNGPQAVTTAATFISVEILTILS